MNIINKLKRIKDPLSCILGIYVFGVTLLVAGAVLIINGIRQPNEKIMTYNNYRIRQTLEYYSNPDKVLVKTYIEKKWVTVLNKETLIIKDSINVVAGTHKREAEILIMRFKKLDKLLGE